MNFFNGENGTSDGTKDGYSQEITGTGGPVNIFIAGEFDGANITLQKRSSGLNKFFDTSAVWTQPDEFQSLIVKTGERYRLVISSSGGSTAVYAEVI